MRIKSVPGDLTRPISDRVKEALFNIIGPDIAQSSLLDLFGGSGSVGIEALSRGANYVRFIDNQTQAITTIKNNLALTSLSGFADVFKSDAFSFLNQSPDRSFDYIYVAPPQYKYFWQKALRLLDKNPGWMNETTWIIIQIHPKEYENMELSNINEFDSRKYGSTQLVFYEVCVADNLSDYWNDVIN